jgi:hypothetical protein
VPSFGVVAASTPYDNTASGLSADNVQDAIDELSALFTGYAPLQQVYTNALGVIEERPGASITTADFGIYEYLSPILDTTPNYNLYSYEDNLTALADSAQGHTMQRYDLHFDRGGGDHDTTGNISLADWSLSHEGIGNVNGLTLANFYVSVGGNGGGSAEYLQGINVNHYIDSASQINQNTSGYSYGLDANGTAGTYVVAYKANLDGVFGGGVDGYYINVAGNITNGLRGFNIDSDADVTLTAEGFGINFSGTADQYNGFRGNSTGSIAGSHYPFGFFTSSPVGGQYIGLGLTLQSAVTQSAQFASFYFDNAATADSFTGVSIGVNGNVADNSQMFSANSNGVVGGALWGMSLTLNGTADDKYGLQINAQDSDGDLYGVNVFLTGSAPSVYGINVSVDSATSSSKKYAAQLSGGSLSSFYEAKTSNLTFGYGDNIHSMSGTFEISAGSPLSSGEFIFGNYVGHTVIVLDDMGPDVLGGVIGFSMNGIASQVAAGVGKTLDTLNFVLAGASIPDVSGLGITDGGTISNVTFFRAIGLLPQGGSVNVTNIYGLRIDSFLTATSPTNAWGVFVDDTNADNYFANCINVGASTKKVANSDVAFEVGSVKTILNGRGTTAQKNAFTALAGMQFYDTDLSKLQWYDGATWQDMGATGFIPIDIQEVPAGLIDSSNTVFTLSQLPISDASVSLFLSGRILEQGVDYTIAGSVATLTTAPLFGQNVFAVYKYGPSGPYTEIQEVPAGAIDNSNVVFTLSQTPAQAAGVALYLDGLIIFQGVDYTIAGSTITLTSIVPNFGQTIYSTYRY